jgi:hypothetical protein
MEKEARAMADTEFSSAEDPLEALRRRLGKPSLPETVRRDITTRVRITSVPSVSQDGELLVPHPFGVESSQPIRLITSVVFSPSGVTESQIDMIALVKEAGSIRKSRPEYLGTIDRNSGTLFDDTQHFLQRLGVGFAVL